MAEKYKYCPRCSQPLEDDGTCPGCTYGHKRNQPASGKTVNPECPWNDHGIKCQNIGSLSDSNNGSGPWYCARHFWQLKGWPVKRSEAATPSYRESWYAERGIEYQAPNLDDAGTLRCTANATGPLLQRLQSGELGPKKERMREPGEDSPEDIGYEDDEIAA